MSSRFQRVAVLAVTAASSATAFGIIPMVSAADECAPIRANPSVVAKVDKTLAPIFAKLEAMEDSEAAAKRASAFALSVKRIGESKKYRNNPKVRCLVGLLQSKIEEEAVKLRSESDDDFLADVSSAMGELGSDGGNSSASSSDSSSPDATVELFVTKERFQFVSRNSDGTLNFESLQNPGKAVKNLDRCAAGRYKMSEAAQTRFFGPAPGYDAIMNGSKFLFVQKNSDGTANWYDRVCKIGVTNLSRANAVKSGLSEALAIKFYDSSKPVSSADQSSGQTSGGNGTNTSATNGTASQVPGTTQGSSQPTSSTGNSSTTTNGGANGQSGGSAPALVPQVTSWSAVFERGYLIVNGTRSVQGGEIRVTLGGERLSCSDDPTRSSSSPGYYAVRCDTSAAGMRIYKGAGTVQACLGESCGTARNFSIFHKDVSVAASSTSVTSGSPVTIRYTNLYGNAVWCNPYTVTSDGTLVGNANMSGESFVINPTKDTTFSIRCAFLGEGTTSEIGSVSIKVTASSGGTPSSQTPSDVSEPLPSTNPYVNVVTSSSKKYLVVRFENIGKGGRWCAFKVGTDTCQSLSPISEGGGWSYLPNSFAWAFMGNLTDTPAWGYYIRIVRADGKESKGLVTLYE